MFDSLKKSSYPYDIPFYRLAQMTRVLVAAQLAMMSWHVYTASPESRKTLVLDECVNQVQVTNACWENCNEYELLASNLPIGLTYESNFRIE